MRRLAAACYHHRKLVLISWVVLLVGLFGLNKAVGGEFRDEFKLPGSESQDGFDLLQEQGFGNQSGFSGQIVFKADGGVEQPQVRAGMEQLFTDMTEQIPDSEITSPYSEEGQRQVAERGPNAGNIAFATIDLADRDSQQFTDAGETARNLVDQADVPGTEIELGGDVFAEPPEFASEGVGLLAAVIILLVAFGSVLAMGLPIITALFGIATGISVVGLVVNVINMPSFSNQAVAMVAIGVGIDYALFIVTRYREGLQSGSDPERSTVRALDTAGRAVLFAGITVIIAVLGLFTIGLSMVRGLAVGIAVGVLMTMLASLTLLPALLGFVGTNIDKLGLPHRRRKETTDHQTVWYRWSRVIQHRPWPALVLSTLFLLVLAIPVLGIRMGFSDASNRPTSDTTREAFDLVADGFGPGFNGPFLLATATPNGEADLATLSQLSETIGQTDGVAAVTPPRPNEDGTAAVFQVFPTTAPQSEDTEALVHTLRDDVIPPVTDGTDLDVKVSGVQAASVDFAEYTASRLPIFIGAVLLLSFILLTAVFRSILVPLKAVIMNLLSVGAAYGCMVMVFQWGWGADLIGVEPGPIEAWVPMMMFAVIFGLSMDYEVFLLSRIREEYDRTGDNSMAVANGVAVTARVITAAAAIMFCVFGAFVLGADRSLKLFGFGLAVAVLLDATIVRLVLVPSTMELLGDKNWWIPKWLDRILPTLHVEATAEDEDQPGPPSAPPTAEREPQPV